MLNTICLEEYGKDLHLCSNEECFHALMKLVAQKGRDRIVKDNGRKVYYISAEFLIGKLLSNNLINLGIYDEVKEELTQAGKNLSDGLFRQMWHTLSISEKSVWFQECMISMCTEKRERISFICLMWRQLMRTS